MIRVNIKKRIKTYSGFNQIELVTSFNTTSVTQIFGPSGVGKTTMLKTIAGLIYPEEGNITVKGETWLDTKSRVNLPPQKRMVGFVFQDYALFPNMTVEQHLLYGTSDALYIERLIALGRLEAFRKHKPRHLSGGQQQRLAILRALSTKPQLILMDEPFSALDSALKISVMSDLKELLTELSTTCLIVTHHPLETNGFAEYSFNME